MMIHILARVLCCLIISSATHHSFPAWKEEDDGEQSISCALRSIIDALRQRSLYWRAPPPEYRYIDYVFLHRPYKDERDENQLYLYMYNTDIIYMLCALCSRWGWNKIGGYTYIYTHLFSAVYMIEKIGHVFSHVLII